MHPAWFVIIYLIFHSKQLSSVISLPNILGPPTSPLGKFWYSAEPKIQILLHLFPQCLCLCQKLK